MPGTSRRSTIALLLALAASISAAQRITTPPRVFEVKEGEAVELPCNVEGLEKDAYVVTWMRGDKMLTMDEDVIVQEDPRLSVDVDGTSYTLTISSLERFDSADYQCSVSVEPKGSVAVTHKVQVLVPPSVSIKSEPVMIVRVGEDVHVKCTAAGNPLPKTVWRRIGGHLPASAKHHHHHDTLFIRGAQVVDSGVYECTGVNGVQPEASQRVEIKVQDGENGDDTAANKSKPWVQTDNTYIPVRLDADVNITCKYDGVPAPNTQWFFNGFPIAGNSLFKNSAQFAVRHINYTETTLTLPAIDEGMFGDYQCRVDNPLGTVDATIYVSGKPGPPSLVLREDDATLSWTVPSVEPINEYQVLYRQRNHDTFSDKMTFRSAKTDQSGDLWERTVKLDFLKPDTEYELQVQARNRLGWGSLSRDYVVYALSKSADNRSKKPSNAASMAARTTWTLLIAPALTVIAARALSR